MDSPSLSSFSWAMRQAVSSHSPEDVTNGMLLLSLRERLDSSVPLPSLTSSLPPSSTREMTPYPPSSLSSPLPQVCQVPQWRIVLLMDGPSHLTSPPITPPSPTSTAPLRKALEHSHKENYKPYSRQCTRPRDLRTRMGLKVTRLFISKIPHPYTVTPNAMQGYLSSRSCFCRSSRGGCPCCLDRDIYYLESTTHIYCTFYFQI